MTNVTSDVVLETLHTLEAQLVRYRGHRAQLEAVYATGDKVLALEALRELRKVLDELAATYVRLRRRIAGFDGAVLGEKVGSFGELALRGQALLVAAEPSRMADARRVASPGAVRRPRSAAECVEAGEIAGPIVGSNFLGDVSIGGSTDE